MKFVPGFYLDAENGAAGDPPTSPAPGAGPAGAGDGNGQPDYQALYEGALSQANEWKNRFTGLQGTYQRDQQKWTSTQTRVSELEGLLSGLDTERNDLRTRVEALSPVQTELEKTQAELSRLTVLIDEFPDLLPIRGSLPEGTGDEWKSKLIRLREFRESAGVQAKEKLLEGAVPPGPKGDAPKGAGELLKAATAELMKGNTAEYNRLYSEYLTALSAK